MSIILKALKSNSEENKTNGATKPADGFFAGRDQLIEKKRSSLFKFDTTNILNSFKTKRVYILAGLFVVVLGFWVGVRIFNGGGQKIVPLGMETVTQPVDQAPAVVTTDSAPAPAPDSAPVAAPQTSADQVNQGMDAFDAGNYDQSITLFKSALETDPNNALIHNSLGLALLEKKLYSNAADEFQKALELDSDCAECFNNLGLLKSILSQPVEAKTYFERAVAISSVYPDPYFNMGVMYEKVGDLGSATKYYKQFLELYPDKSGETYSMVKKRIAELTGQ